MAKAPLEPPARPCWGPRPGQPLGRGSAGADDRRQRWSPILLLVFGFLALIGWPAAWGVEAWRARRAAGAEGVSEAAANAPDRRRP